MPGANFPSVVVLSLAGVPGEHQTAERGFPGSPSLVCIRGRLLELAGF